MNRLTSAALSLALTLLCGPANGLAATYVQSAICSVLGPTAASSYTCTLPGPTTAGNVIVVAAATNGTVTAFTFSDDKSGSYAAPAQSLIGSPNASAHSAIGVGTVGTPGTTVVTATWTNSVQPTFYAICALEYSGVNTSTPVDVSDSNGQATPTTTTDATTSTAQTTTANGETVIGAAFVVTGTSNVTAGTGFTSRETFTTGTRFRGTCEDLVQTSAGSIAATWTAESSINDTVALMVALKNVTAAAVPQQNFSGVGILY